MQSYLQKGAKKCHPLPLHPRALNLRGKSGFQKQPVPWVTAELQHTGVAKYGFRGSDLDVGVDTASPSDGPSESASRTSAAAATSCAVTVAAHPSMCGTVCIGEVLLGHEPQEAATPAAPAAAGMARDAAPPQLALLLDFRVDKFLQFSKASGGAVVILQGCAWYMTLDYSK